MRWKVITSALGFVLTILTTPAAVGALKCAVCLPARQEDGGAALAQEIRDQFPGLTLPVCPHNEDRQAAAHGPTEVHTCPAGSRGCHQQRSGKWTARTCSFLAVDDCQTANWIEYCYCQGDRCNSPHPHTTAFAFTSTTTRATPIKTKEPSIVQSIKSSASRSPSVTFLLIVLLTLVSCCFD